MIVISVEVEWGKPMGSVMPASEWMFPHVEKFWKKCIVFSPYWTGALRSSIAMEEDPRGAGWTVEAGDPEIHNPITGTPTSDYAPIQEEEKHFMAEAYQISGVDAKLRDAAARVLK